jgi:biopolymer transport protein ExbB
VDLLQPGGILIIDLKISDFTATVPSGKASIDVVAGPIGEALIATAIGIGAAVPAVFFYNYLVRKLKLQSIEMDTFVEAFLRLASINAKNK